MAPKRPAPAQGGPDGGKRFRENVSELFLDNALSGQRAQSVFADAVAAGAAGVRDLARAGTSGKHPGNCNRDLLTTMLKTAKRNWPPLYKAKIRVRDLKTGQEVRAPLPFLLPHAVLHKWLLKDPALLRKLTAISSEMQVKVSAVAAELGCNAADIVPFGLHGDGVPFNSERSRSLEVWSFNFPCEDEVMRRFRVPVCAIDKRFVAKDATYRDIQEVIAWSFRLLAIGQNATRRHDGTDFAETDGLRRFAGQPMPCRGILAELRADWAWYKATMDLPQHNEVAGCCWLCTCKPDEIRTTDLSAPWRQRPRLSHEAFLQRLFAAGRTPSPLFSLPGVTNQSCLLDWLHTADLGVGADALGNILVVVVDKLPGASQAARVQALWAEMQQFYSREKSESRLDTLTWTMLKQPGKAAKLRGKAAEVRGLVKFGWEMSMKYLDGASVYEKSVQTLARLLMECYDQLHTGTFSPEALGSAARRFAATYVALDDATADLGFRTKPKLHLFLEMCEVVVAQNGCPSRYWTYRDEDFGGELARSARRRGGKTTPWSTALRMLQRFLARRGLPGSS